jgi:hypothetical protein
MRSAGRRLWSRTLWMDRQGEGGGRLRSQTLRVLQMQESMKPLGATLWREILGASRQQRHLGASRLQKLLGASRRSLAGQACAPSVARPGHAGRLGRPPTPQRGCPGSRSPRAVPSSVRTARRWWRKGRWGHRSLRWCQTRLRREGPMAPTVVLLSCAKPQRVSVQSLGCTTPENVIVR